MKHRSWRKQEIKTNDGYRLISMPDHLAANSNGYVPKHRLLAEKLLGRKLKSQEGTCFINNKTKKVVPENIMVFNNIGDASKYSLDKYKYIDPNNIIFNGYKYLAEHRNK